MMKYQSKSLPKWTNELFYLEVNMKTLSVAFLFLCFIFLPFTISAEVKTFTHEVKQPFSGSQSPDDARVAATHKAKREVLEKAGTYLESLRVVERGRLKKDQVLALASGVLKAEIISQKNYMAGEGFGIIIKARVKVDTNVLEERVKKLMADRTAMEQLEDVRKREKELLAKVKRLEKTNSMLAKKKETHVVKQKRKELKKDFQQATKGLDAVALKDQANGLWKDGKFSNPKRVIELLNKAIELDPNYVKAYNNRGVSYLNLKQYARAIQDFDKAIELDPAHASSYNNRGNSYSRLKRYNRAIQDYNKAIELDPGLAAAYYGRGNQYNNLKQHARAIQDFDKAIELDPGYAWAYNNRGHSYFKLKQYNRAIQDYNKAINLDPGSALTYNNRGIAYMKINRVSRGCADLKKACEFGICKSLKRVNKKGKCL